MTTILDVRSPAEYASGHINNAVNVPVDQLAQRLSKQQCQLKKDERLLVYCASGGRSSLAQGLLQRAGYQDVINAGGYHSLRQQLAADNR